MKAPGRFIVSFDCEGKWGMADHLTPALNSTLTTQRLESIYRQILSALDKAQIKATFAFVGAFTIYPEQYMDYADRLMDVPIGGRPWLEAFRRDAVRGNFDGWFAPRSLLAVQESKIHEIATHGFTHLPLSDKFIGPAAFDYELEQARLLASTQGWIPRTLIYPRNQIGYVDRLARHGILGYRELLWPNVKGRFRQVSSLIAELGWIPGTQQVLLSDGPVPIPPGHILNFWHNRTRRLISRKRTFNRWRQMLRHAADYGGVAHLWSHPHNFLTDPNLLPIFEQIVLEAGTMIREGKLKNQTQFEYCCELKSRKT